MGVESFTALHRGGSGEPLVLLHGFTDTWRSWELAIPTLERGHDVLAPTLPGHAGGPELRELGRWVLADAVERAMDEAGFETAHLAGNSLGGYVALQLASRGRARSVTAFAPAGGWAEGDESFRETLAFFRTTQRLLARAVPHVDAIVASPEGRRRATEFIVSDWEHIPPELIAHQMLGASRCPAVEPLIGYALEHGWELDADSIECPLRFVWGTADRILGWPATAARYRELFPGADWVELPGVGHCPQLDVPAEAAGLILA